MVEGAVGALIMAGSVILSGIFCLVRRWRIAAAFLCLAIFSFLYRSLTALYFGGDYSAYTVTASGAGDVPAGMIKGAGSTD